jgi:hypothetical protein
MSVASCTTICATVVIISLILVGFATRSVYYSDLDEPFSSWGYDGPETTEWDNSDFTKTVGPDPDGTELETWQYHPQNTLVDYRFYNRHSPKFGTGSRLSPIVDGKVGTVNQTSLKVPDMYNVSSTRVPDHMSDSAGYVISNPATNTPISYPSTEYTY